ncbi:hypothetical protein ECC02_011017 [Trypanosoma cruzi]|uniref:Uncharacterized protein n=1 Tax=Trypanosoma cruzi TaxID=5693 RepID=A0A7J6XPS1_TRYCR|nr:hypothetical protein ECC02_011017 [Trypanosoma cruzi]
MRRASIHNPAQRRSWKPGVLLPLCRRFAPENCNVSCMQTHGKAEPQFITSNRRFAGSLLHCTIRALSSSHATPRNYSPIQHNIRSNKGDSTIPFHTVIMKREKLLKAPAQNRNTSIETTINNTVGAVNDGWLWGAAHPWLLNHRTPHACQFHVLHVTGGRDQFCLSHSMHTRAGSVRLSGCHQPWAATALRVVGTTTQRWCPWRTKMTSFRGASASLRRSPRHRAAVPPAHHTAARAAPASGGPPRTTQRRCTQ